MRKNHVKNIIIHDNDSADFLCLTDKVNAFHVEIIERKLNQSTLTKEEKIVVIDKILKILKSREINGII